MDESEFNYVNASKIEINDGSINCIWLECSIQKEINSDNALDLTDGYNALIEFSNGKKMIITNSEWCSLNWILK